LKKEEPAKRKNEMLENNNQGDEYDISRILEKEAEVSLHGPYKGILPCQERAGGYYPLVDMSIWLRSCTHEVTDPVLGKVTGTIPEWLEGNFLQNGPGKFYFGANDVFNHLFDGSALVQKYVVRNGQVSYQCRYLRTNSFKNNLSSGRIVSTEFGTNPNSTELTNNSKTSLANRMSKLAAGGIEAVMSDNALISINAVGSDFYCHYESPYIIELDVDTLKTRSRIDLNKAFGALSHGSHPHFDDEGNMISLSLKPGLKGLYYTVTKIPLKDPEATKIEADLELEESWSKDRFWHGEEIAKVQTRWRMSPGYMHSFSVTDNYYVLIEQPLCINIPKMARSLLSRSKSVIDGMVWYGDTDSTIIHAVPKPGSGHKPFQFEAPAFFFLHTINAYEDRGHIVLDISTYKNPHMLHCMGLKELATAQSNPDYATLFRGRPNRYVLPLMTKEAMRSRGLGANLVTLDYTSARAQLVKNSVWLTPQLLADVGCETPTIDYARFRSRHYRYFYAITSDVDDADSAGKVYKIDTLTGEVKSFYEENTYCAEPFFLPRPGAVAEDDGVLVSSMIRGVPEVSWTGLIVLDAKNLTEIARAEFQLKSPVPKPLHGCFAQFKGEPETKTNT